MAINAALSSFSFGGTTVAAVGSASIAMSRPSLEVTEIGAPSQGFIAGVGGATANLDLFYDQDSAAHTSMMTNINTAAVAAAVVLTLETGDTISGNAYVTSFEVTAQAGSVVRASVQLQFTNAAATATIVTITNT